MRSRKFLSVHSRPLTFAAAVAALSLGSLAEAAAQKFGVAGPGFKPSVNAVRTPPANSARMPPANAARPPEMPDLPSRGGRRGPDWGGVATGIGVGIATGILIDQIARANDAPPPPPPYGRGPGPQSSQPRQPQGPRVNVAIPPASEQRFVPDEVVLEFASNISPQAVNTLAVRHRLAPLESQVFQLTNSTFFRGRITDRRPVRTVLRALGSEATLRAVQPNYLYRFAKDEAEAAETGAEFAPLPPEMPEATPAVASSAAMTAGAGDPAQYTVGKLRLQEAHSLARGDNVLVAVIDSAIDVDHPELAGVIAGSFDALQAGEKPHVHGTAIAGAIAARSRLMGVAPAARILAISAFGVANATAEATTFAILKSIDHAASQGARIVNMSFAGPADPGLARQLAAARGKGIVLIAAAGNAGPKSAPLYPAADPNVIAVTATDAEDKLFSASNRGRHIAIAAPGVDILLPSPEKNYQVISGTSFAAAHVSGIAALILERKPDMSPDALRKILLSSAKDLGPRGKDDQFGAGLADAYQAILALEPKTAAGTAPALRPAAAVR
jgi:hypothetical protein